MKKLKSKRGIPIPTLFFITDREEIKDIPKGVPYFIGSADTEDYMVAILEYEVLLQKAKTSGYPFDFKAILRDQGYWGLEYRGDVGIETNLGLKKGQDSKGNKLVSRKNEFIDFIVEGNCYVDMNIIKELNIFPVWMETLESAISTNIYKFATFDSNMYNKKLDGMYGGMKLNSPPRNLIIIDISGSIPRQVSSTCLVIARNMAESFYADLMITGSKTTLYPYEQIHELDVNNIFNDNGLDNDRVYFQKLLEGDERVYDTLIVFGDQDSPGWTWRNEFNVGLKKMMSDQEGKDLNKWKVNNIISFHAGHPYMNDDKTIAAYGRWFESSNVKFIHDWVKYLR
jgi:hypothetical protein